MQDFGLEPLPPKENRSQMGNNPPVGAAVFKIYPFEKHQLTIDKIDPDALYILEKLHHAGFIAYLVGGSVRDLLLKQKPKDYDISTSAEPEQIKKIFRNCILIGRRFRLAHIRFGHKIFEVSTFRSGDNATDTLIIRDNVWGSPEEDVARRDFTINGLFYDATSQTIIDYADGYPDIESKYLRTIGQPFIRFKQDPVRMLRLLKFQARFNFTVDPVARVALLECRHEICKSSPARIQEELLRMLESGSSEKFFRLLTEHGLLHLLSPVLGDFLESSDSETVYAYLNTIDQMIKEGSNSLLDRSILIACLIFSLLDMRIKHRYTDRKKTPHLGDVYSEVQDLVHETFRPFFQLSRRLRVGLISILTAQYRLTPIEPRKHRKLRIPYDPDFPKALDFLAIRATIEPALQQPFQEWSEAYTSAHRLRARKRKPKKDEQ